MRTASVLAYLAPRYGGPPNLVIKMGQELEKFGVEQSFWATASNDERRELAYLGDKAFLFKATFPRSWYRSGELSRNMESHMSEVDLFHIHQVWDYPVYAAAKLARRYGKPYMITPHGIFADKWRYDSLKKRVYLRLIALPLLNGAACVRAVADTELEGFKDIGIKAPYTLVPNGVNVDEFRDLPQPGVAEGIWPDMRGRLVALYMGRLSPEKGLDLLLDAWKMVVNKIPRAFLMIAGPDFRGRRARLEKQVKVLGLGERVSFSGMLGGELKKAAFSRADVYVQPSYSEGFSGSVLEALASAKPCVITKGCNFREMAGAGAGEIVAPNAGELSRALSKFLSLTDKERLEMGNRGLGLVRDKYTLDVMARKMLTVYQCILEHRPIPLYPEPAEAIRP